jgi:hypothetical protein
MHWIESKDEFDKILAAARMCVYIDSRRQSTHLHLLHFDDVTLCTPQFANLLQDLIMRSEEGAAHFIVVEPHPSLYFYRSYGKYPALEIARGDSAEDYLKKMNEDPEGNSGDCVSNVYTSYVVVPPSNGWFIHAIRSSDDNSGHLWVPPEWMGELVQAHPFLFREETGR